MIKLLQTSVKRLDLFSPPFEFFLSNDIKRKQTYFGGCTSIIILGLGLAYFIYICLQYFGDQLNPTVTETASYLHSNFQMVLNNTILSFKVVLPSGKLLQQLESETGLTYLNIIATYTEENNDGSFTVSNLPFIPCEDPLLKDQVCLDFTQVDGNKKELSLAYNVSDIEANKINIKFIQCTPSLLNPGEKCASPQQIKQEVVRMNTFAIMRMSTQQYNVQNHEFESKVKQEVVQFSDGISTSTKIALQKTTTNINDGFILSTNKQQLYFSDYYRYDYISTMQFMQQETGLDILNQVFIFIGSTEITQQIQFPYFTSLLAQFSSVFNVMLLVGFLCQYLAQSELIQDIVEVKLKTYYKRTALFILNQYNMMNSKVDSMSTDLPSALTTLHFQIQNMDYRYYMKKFLNLSTFQRFKLFVCSGFKQDISKKDPKQVKLFKELINSTQQQMNILEIEKELMQLKIMLRIILSVEQYAAIQLCGYSINKQTDNNQELFVNKQNIEIQELQKQQDILSVNNLINQHTNTQDVKLLSNTNEELSNKTLKQCDQKQLIQNHLDKINCIEKDQNYFKRCIEGFLNKNMSPSSEIDQRILDCMIGMENNVT